MSYQYPLDVADLMARVKKRGDDFVKYLGIDDGMRDDRKLTAIAWGVPVGTFPVDNQGRWNEVLEIGLPAQDGDSLYGISVKAIGDGEVVFADENVLCGQEFDFGRVIVRHQTPAGEDFYFEYRHLEEVKVWTGTQVAAGDEIGTLGWHGDFPHLGFSVASLERIGGDKDLIPEHSRDSLPPGDAAFNTLRVRVDALDPDEWPIDELADNPGYVFNAIEMVRYCRGEPYEHDIGFGSLHKVTPATDSCGRVIDPEVHQEIQGTVLRSAALKDNKTWAALSHDPGFQPVGKGYSESAAVKAIQRALKECQYDIGRFGPDNDGVDGDYGQTTERVVRHFQDTKLREMLKQAGNDGILGRQEGDLKVDGKIDWLTLIALDVYAKAHEEAPPPPKPKPKTDPPPPRPPDPSPPASGPWVFDGVSKKTSLRLGMKMYKVLLGWESDGTKGVGYSTCRPASKTSHYGKVIPKEISPEWPDIGLDANGSVEVKDDNFPSEKGNKYPVYNCFGVSWVGSNFTNCCNSQMAALVCALGGKEFGIKKADGTQANYDIRKDKVKVKIKAKVTTKAKNKGEKDKTSLAEIQRGALVVFEQTFVNGTLFYDLDGNPLYGSKYGGMMYAVKFLEIGELLFPFSTKQEELKKMRAGDWAAYDHHAWLVGDIRYGIWFGDNKGKNPDRVLDQSSFIDSENGKTFTIPKGKKTNEVGGRSPMTSADCDWVIANEAEFERRVGNFLAAANLVDEQGTKHDVAKVEVLHWRVFSANGTSNTAHSKEYDLVNGGFVLNENKTKARAKVNGVTRPWCPRNPEAVSLCRLYGPA